MVFITDGKIGSSPNTSAVDDGFSLNTTASGNEGVQLLRVVAGSAVSQYDVVHVNTSGTALPITAALANSGGRIAFAQTALGSGETGWVHLTGNGNIKINVAASCNPLVPLYTTDTAGRLDDATASLSHNQIQGVMITLTNSATISALPGIVQGAIVRIPRV